MLKSYCTVTYYFMSDDTFSYSGWPNILRIKEIGHYNFQWPGNCLLSVDKIIYNRGELELQALKCDSPTKTTTITLFHLSSFYLFHIFY